MKNYKSLGNYVPYPFFKYLFGDRKLFGKKIDYNDKDWRIWEKTYLEFYQKNQKQSIGKVVNDAGYNVLRKINFRNKDILELGPGQINHFKYWNCIPKSYAIADIQKVFLDLNDAFFKRNDINYSKHLIKSNFKLPFRDCSKDIIITFYQLEHLYPLKAYLDEYLRILKPNGILIGAIPSEGGLAWGIGRFLTTRRWFMNNTEINPDKIICWEHPNFADFILNTINKKISKKYISFWPFLIPSIDINLIIKFVFKKTK